MGMQSFCMVAKGPDQPLTGLSLTFLLWWPLSTLSRVPRMSRGIGLLSKADFIATKGGGLAFCYLGVSPFYIDR